MLRCLWSLKIPRLRKELLTIFKIYGRRRLGQEGKVTEIRGGGRPNGFGEIYFGWSDLETKTILPVFTNAGLAPQVK